MHTHTNTHTRTHAGTHTHTHARTHTHTLARTHAHDYSWRVLRTDTHLVEVHIAFACHWCVRPPIYTNT
jgi:methionine-rich copper-binding protein CopC